MPLLPVNSPLSRQDRGDLLRIARAALESYFAAQDWKAELKAGEALRQQRAAFVTLRDRRTGVLRGCRGEVRPRRALVESVAQQAVNAATDDPRFAAVTAEEVPTLSIHISALGPLEPIDPGKIELGRHGLMIVQKGRSGLLLPQVPALYEIETVPEFLDMLCRKAGLPPRVWLVSGVELLAFEAESWGEGEAEHQAARAMPP